MADTTAKTAEALAAEARKLASVLRGMVECGAAPEDLWERDQPDGDPFVARAAELLELLAAHPQPEPAEDDVRELRKWLNEEPNRPIDRAALARVLAAQPQAEVVPEGLQAVPVIAYLHHDSAFSWPGQRVDVSSAKRMVLLEDVEAALSARPPMAPPAPAARRELGWNGPMVNDATPQAEPVAADGWAQAAEGDSRG